MKLAATPAASTVAMLAVLLGACSPGAAHNPGPASPTLPGGGQVVVATFEGSVDPTGRMTVAVRPTPQLPSGVASVVIPSGTGAGTVTVANDPADGPPATIASGCGPGTDGYQGSVKITNNDPTVALHGVYAELTFVSLTGHEACNSDPVPSGVSATWGAWYYGTLEAGGSPNRSWTVPWRFKIPTTQNFTFRGQVVATQVTAPAWTTIPNGQMVNTSFAIKADGSLWAWGSNSRGEFATGAVDASPHTIPTKIGLGFAEISGSRIARKTDGSVVAWGANDTGQMANGLVESLATKVYRFTTIALPGTVTKVAGGDRTSYALKSDGTLWAWGDSLKGQIGDGVDHLGAPVTTPAQVLLPAGMTRFTDVAAGENDTGFSHALALTTDGVKVGCPYGWGANGIGQVGDKNLGVDELSPVALNKSANCLWTSLAAGVSHSHGIDTSLAPIEYKGWGLNSSGELGDATTKSSDVPSTMLTALGGTLTAGFVSMYAGGAHAFGVTSVAGGGGALWGWGDNSAGQLGSSALSPALSVASQIGSATNWSKVSAGRLHTLAFRTDGTLWSAGSNASGQLGNAQSGVTVHDFTQVP